jgi:cytochrome bd ubiquinol oxidase subunit II
MGLEITWFCLICVLWTGYFVLEGFDFGVGMLLPFVGKNQDERGTMLKSIGPVWDGNEVWLVVAGGATFAAFPVWYATMFSGFYLALLLILVFLVTRVVSFEWREKAESPRWKAVWASVNTIASYCAPLLWGIALANLLHGVPIGSDQNFAGDFGDLFSGYTILAGIAVVLLFAAHGAVFLRLRMTGDLYDRVRRAAALLIPAAAVVGTGFLVWTLVVASDRNDKGVFPGILPVLVAAISALAAIWAVRAARDRLAFVATAATIVAVVVTLFVSLYPRVMVSNPNFANSLTIDNASSADYTLKVMTVVAAVLIPVILLYQAWTYRVFRARITGAPVGSPADLLGRKPGE